MSARLVPLTEGSTAIPLEKAITLIGRHPDCDAVLADNQKVSRRHCCIAQVDDRLIIRDLGSMNGIRVNGETVVESDLAQGDSITIGDEEFFLELLPGKSAGRNGGDRATAQPPSALPSAKPKPVITQKPSVLSKPVPKPLPAAMPPKPRPMSTPADISQEFPVAIPDDVDEVDSDNQDDEYVEIVEEPEISPQPVIPSLDQLKFIDDVAEDIKPDPDVFKLDSGEIQLREIDAEDPRKK